MSPQSSRRVLHWLALAWLCLPVVAPVHAATRVTAASLEVPGIQLKDLSATLDHADDGQLQLILTASQADIPALGWRRVGISLRGRLRRLHENVWSCRGDITLDRAPGGLLRRQQPFVMTIDTGANTLELDLGPVPRPMLSVAMPLDQLTHVQARMSRLPLSWLQGPLAQALKGRLTSGTVSGTLATDFGSGGVQGSALLDLAGAGFDGGSLAAQKLGFKGRVNFSTDTGKSRTSVSGELRGGEVLLGPLYARLPARPVQLGFELSSQGARMRLNRVRFTDPGTLSLAGNFDFDRNGNLGTWSLGRFEARLPAAYQRYGKTWLDTHGWRDLKTSGELGGALAMGSGGWRELRMHAHDLNLSDAQGRFRVHGLEGGLDWKHNGTRPPTTLSWKGLGMYRIPLGAGSSQWRSRDGTLELLSPVSVPLLDGQLRLQRFAWNPASAQGQRIDLAATVNGVDLSRFSRALGWPAFRGTLAGAMPGLHYADGKLQLEGGLSLNVFDGFVDVTRMSLTHPFGDTPELAADIDLRQMDLGAMTDVFHFGKITGRMHGTVAGLHLVDWKPVGFEAQLLADKGGRISQRAVNNLTSVGGGGSAGGLQGAVLRLFKSFRYSRIGLNCTLAGSTCRMGGLKPQDGGYLIVEGEGLPHLTVIGHQRQVSWPTLVSRLRAAINSGGPVVHGQ